jgi:hypothetical protein
MRRLGWLIVALGLLGLGLGGLWVARMAGVPTPDYAVETRDGAIELRRYPDLVTAEVTTEGPRQTGVRQGFGPLARYIFARERAPGAGTEKIAMTAPVTQTAAGPDTWQVRFIMPEPAGSGSSLPAPAGDVRLVDWPAHRAAAIRFSGRWTDARFAAAEAQLRSWMNGRRLVAAGPVTYAYYNDPFTPAFLRRNEVLLPVQDAP